MRRSLATLLLLVASCRGGDENLGLARSDEALDLTRLDRPGRLERVLRLPAAAVERKLGPHRREQTSKLTLSSGERGETFSETWKTAFDGTGVHALHETSRGEGLEWLAIGDRLFVRLVPGRFASRSPQGDEVERWRDEQAHVLAGYLDVLGPFARRQEGGGATVAGRPALRVTLSLDGEARSPEEGDPARAWRKTIKVSSLAGEISLDAASGAVLAARLDAAYTFTRGDRTITVKLEHRGQASDLGAVARLAPPADVGPPPARPRPMVDRATLLEGLITGHE